MIRCKSYGTFTATKVGCDRYFEAIFVTSLAACVGSPTRPQIDCPSRTGLKHQHQASAQHEKYQAGIEHGQLRWHDFKIEVSTKLRVLSLQPKHKVCLI